MSICRLGSFTFALNPERELVFENNREIAKVDIPGGDPVYQDMGEGESTLNFSGVLNGDTSLTQMNAIEALRKAGKVVKFSFEAINCNVRIRKFAYKIRRLDYIQYDIELVKDYTSSASSTSSKTQKNSNSSSSSSSKKTYKTVIIKKGETLILLAKIYNTTWQAIAALNHIVNVRKIPAGTKLLIP